MICKFRTQKICQMFKPREESEDRDNKKLKLMQFGAIEVRRL